MHPSTFRAPALLLAAALAIAYAPPAMAGDHGACGAAAAAKRTAAAAHPNAANRAKAKARRVVPTAPARAAGLVAIIDPATGALAPATPEQIGALTQAKQAGGATALAAEPAIEVVRLPDGTLMANVPPSLRAYAIAHVGPDGKVTFTCGDEHAATAPAAPAGPATQAKWEDR